MVLRDWYELTLAVRKLTRRVNYLYSQLGPGSSGTDFYAADGTIDSNRTINLDGKLLTFSDLNTTLRLDPPAYQAVFNIEDFSSAQTQLVLTADAIGSNISFLLSANVASGVATSIEGSATISNITYTADEHLFVMTDDGAFGISDGVRKWADINVMSRYIDLSATIDGDVTAQLHLAGAIGVGVSFQLITTDNIGSTVQIAGDGVAKTLVSNANAQTHSFTGLYTIENSSFAYLRADVGDDRIQLQNTVGSKIDINDDNDYVQIQYKDATTKIELGGGSSTITHITNELFVKTSTYTPGLFHVSESNGRVDIGDFDDEVNGTKIELNDNTQTITHTAGDHIFIGVVEFADNAAALLGGKAVGTIYRTADVLKIVH